MTTQALHELPYASPAQRARAPVWAGAVILAAGVAMVVLGGCFLLGAMRIVMSPFQMGNTPSTLTISLVAMLYLCCLACFATAIVLLIVGTRALLRVAAA